MSTRGLHLLSYLRHSFYFLLSLYLLSACGGQPAEDAEDTVLPSELATLIASEGDQINFNPLSADSNQEQIITIQNTGRLPASEIRVEGMTEAFGFKGGEYPGTGGDCEKKIGAGQSCTVVLNFSGSMTESLETVLSFHYRDGLSGSRTLILSLSNSKVDPSSLVVSKDQLNFGTQFVGQSVDQELMVSNPGKMKVTSLQLTGLSAPFSFKGGKYPGEGGNCASELAAESSCKIVFEFTANAASESNLSVQVRYNNSVSDQEVSVGLRGVGQELPVPLVLGLSSDSTPTKSKAWSWTCSLDCQYRFAVNQSSTHSFSSENFVDTDTYTQGTLTGGYYLHVQARDKALGGLSEVVSVMAVLDNTKPTVPGVISYGNNMTESEAPTTSWLASTDETDLKGYEVAIGQTQGGNDILDWTDVGNLLTYNATGLSLETVKNYYTSVRAVDVAGNYSEVREGAAWSVPGSPNAITDLAALSATYSTIKLSWTAPADNGRAITDYRIFYKASSDGSFTEFDDGEGTALTATVTGLAESTSYDFKVLAFNGASSEDSNVVTFETMVNDPFFEPDVFTAINIGGAVESSVVALEDNTLINRNGSELVTLNAGETHVFASTINDVLDADKPIFVAGRRGSASTSDQKKGNMVWSYAEWAGKEFYFTASRDKPHLINVYAFEGATISVYKGGNLLEERAVTANGNHEFTINDYGGFKISSTGAIIAHMHSNKGGSTVTDPKPLLPESKELIGIPSRDGRITTSSGTASFTAILSDGASTDYQVSSGSEKVINGVGPGDRGQEYQAEAMLVKADIPIVAHSRADLNGYCAAPFLPVNRMKKRYAINVNSKWVAFASKSAGTITVTFPDGTQSTVDLVRSVEGNDIPYKARLTNLPGGTRFEASVPFAAWYQPSTNSGAANNDETILFGY